MAYIDTNARTMSPTSNEKQQLLGRFNLLNGIYVGIIKDTSDVHRDGRLRVWIPELGSAPDEENGWMIVSYCSPFAGATNVQTASKNIQDFDGTQTSYGMWMVPPDINNQVLVIFANGDTARGFWIGCIYNQYMNNMVPGMSASSSNYQYPDKCIPVAEYNKWDIKTTNPDQTVKPYQKTKFQGLGNQGLINDCNRGITSSSARRESPSTVFGILTPGPPIKTDAPPEEIRRKGGSSFIMDDETGSEYVQLTTKSGTQIKLDETNGFVYLINRDGTSWVQMDKDGNVDIFGARDISMRAQRDFNIRADRNINIEAGQNLFMKAAKDTREETVEFTYDVNNVPQSKSIPVWKYKGQGQGDGGNIVMESLNNWHNTTHKNTYLTTKEGDMNIHVGHNLNVQTMTGGQNFNSKQAIMLTTEASVDIAAKGNIRIGSEGSINVVGLKDVIFCTSASMTLKSQVDINLAAAKSVLVSAMDVAIDAKLKVSGTAELVAKYATIAAARGSVKNITAPSAKPANAEGAMSSGPARLAEIKPKNDKINILATWEDKESKFKRNAEAVQTTVSRFPTYEPCPEHENFTLGKISEFKANLTETDKTYEGSGASGNDARQPPVESTNPGADNTLIEKDAPVDSNISKDINLSALRQQLILHEGFKNKVYHDSLGLPTGGIGHLLRKNEIPKYPVGTPLETGQIEAWYTDDCITSIKIAQDLIGSPWANLSDVRRRAVIDLAFNLGRPRLSKFIGFITSMKKGDYNTAGRELKDSKWWTQVGKRGPNIQTMVVHNADPTSPRRA